eukprot:5930521-Amphidinium_carterae.1
MSSVMLIEDAESMFSCSHRGTHKLIKASLCFGDAVKSYSSQLVRCTLRFVKLRFSITVMIDGRGTCKKIGCRTQRGLPEPHSASAKE